MELIMELDEELSLASIGDEGSWVLALNRVVRLPLELARAPARVALPLVPRPPAFPLPLSLWTPLLPLVAELALLRLLLVGLAQGATCLVPFACFGEFVPLSFLGLSTLAVLVVVVVTTTVVFLCRLDFLSL